MFNSRRLRYRITKSPLRAPLIWLRHRGLDRNDVFLASYPRSGSTWLRFLLSEILTRDSAAFDKVNRAIPEIGLHVQAVPVLPGEGRLIKTHEPYRREYHKAVYLLRDARDVVLSEHARENGLNLVTTDFDGYVAAFVRGEVAGFGSWQNHIPSWLDSPLAKAGNLLVVKFEDMRRNTEQIVAKILEFLGFQAEPGVIQAAIANNSVERMRAKEKDAQRLLKTTKAEGSFVRRGSVGGWREKLTEKQIELVEQYAGDALTRMGYPLVSKAAAEVGTPVNARQAS